MPRLAVSSFKPAVAGVWLVLIGWIAYATSFRAPFLFDDNEAILPNATIRHLTLAALQPPANGSGVTGRPLVNLSLAINYALGGMNPAGYHLFNLVLHASSALVLFGLVRRTLLQPVLRPRFGHVALSVSWFAAALWSVHPLQTESVTGVIQRTEGLVGFFYLFALYSFVRGAGDPPSWFWQIATVASCLLGMASKEVMVSAPLLILLYDRTFVAGSFAGAWRRRRGWYVGLAATWVLLGALLLHSGGSRGASAGFGLGVTPWEYARKQCEAILLYLRLSFWPHPLVVDYGYDSLVDPKWIWWQAALLSGLLVATGVALWWKPVAGFLGAWFFIILAPSSSIVPLITQTMAEHRMYLPLAAVMVAAVTMATVLVPHQRARLIVGLAVVASFCALTLARNADYRSAIALWQDTIAKRPQNPRAWHGLGVEWAKDDARTMEAIAAFREAIRLDPTYAEAHYGLGLQLAKLPDGTDEAITHYMIALEAMPMNADVHLYLGVALGKKPDRRADAIRHCQRAVELNPDNATAHNNLATLLLTVPERRAEAIAHYETSLRLRPDHPETHYNLANALAQSPDQIPAALGHYARALELRPTLTAARYNLANELARLPGRLPEAVEQYEQIIKLEPQRIDAHFNLAIALAKSGRTADAMREFETVLQMNPGAEAARRYLDLLRSTPR